MLKLRRRKSERIVVIPPDSGPVRVTVVEIDSTRGVVWIGFEADAETEIYREEVYQRIQQERRSAGE